MTTDHRIVTEGAYADYWTKGCCVRFRMCTFRCTWVQQKRIPNKRYNKIKYSKEHEDVNTVTLLKKEEEEIKKIADATLVKRNKKNKNDNIFNKSLSMIHISNRFRSTTIPSLDTSVPQS